MLGNLFEQRAVSFQTVWGAGEPWGLQSEAGVNVTTKKSFEIVAFFSAVSLISDTISTLPCGAYLRVGPIRRPLNPRPMWLDQPDVDLSTRAAFFQQVFSSLLVHGNSYTRVFRDSQGQVVNLVNLNPEKVEVERSKVGRKIYRYEGENKVLTSDEVIHIVDLILPGELKGMSRVETLKQSLGLNIALSDYAARFFGTGASAAGVIEFPGNLTSEQAKQLADGFDARHRNGSRRAHKTGVLSGGAKFVSTQTDPESSQALESRKFAVEEIARAFNVPLHLMGVPGTASYASVEQNNLQFISMTLRPMAEKVEAAFSRLLPGDAFIKFQFNDLLRADLEARIRSYSVGAQAGFYSTNDIRRLEDLPPVEQGDQYRVPLANIALADTQVITDEKKMYMLTQLVQSGFSPSESLAALGLPEIEHTGLPSIQLQGVAQVNPDDPESVYGA
ncbi:COG4695 Phage-related protein [uncultured Caudovirales phage]|uniref:COG4695 Phage-related protein n=1 Tax=uncultured Caudovirales phage TaxID=2100421 RepID=A0A6J5M6P2_9CAUD|nr:COG4695 Phage-related protein [uncultured Caudovirales phage]